MAPADRFTIRSIRAGELRDGTKIIREAIAEFSDQSGIDFVDDGLSQERRASNTSLTPLPDGRWPPVQISWSNGRESPDIAGEAVGAGGSYVFAPNGPETARYVSGGVLLDSEAFPVVAALGGDTPRTRR